LLSGLSPAIFVSEMATLFAGEGAQPPGLLKVQQALSAH
jgi:hypothetical protein